MIFNSVTYSRIQTCSPLFYAEYVLFYQYGHPCIMQNTSFCTSVVTPILCRTVLFYQYGHPYVMQNSFILPVCSPLYYAEHVLFYQYDHPYIMQNTSFSTSMVTPVLCRTRFVLPVWLYSIMQNTRVHFIALANEIL